MKFLKWNILIALALLFGSIGFVVMLIMTIMSDGDDQEDMNIDIMEGEGVSIDENVKRYEDIFKKYAKENGIEDQIDILMALTMQESGGREMDVMQSSESQGDSPGTISDPKKSIKVGIAYFADLYRKADGKIKLTLQAYNMGGGFINYAEKHNDGKYSEDLAQEFSDKQKRKTGNDTYGDPNYVQHVMKYVGEIENPKEFKGGKWGPPLKRDLDVTSGYGGRDDPINNGKEDHLGIDFACSAPDKVIAVHDGVVYKSGNDAGGWGNHVIIKNSENELSVVGHLSDIKASKGDKVKQGDTIGVCGQSGAATGPHVHLEYWDSIKGGSDKSHRKDPNKMLKDKGDDKDE